MRVLVIGAGPCGLAAVKCCLDEGLDVVCFEQRPYAGGLWQYDEQVHEGWSAVMRGTVTNTNKELMGFSDFPAPKEFPAYMPHSRYLEYCRLYADHFKLAPHVRHNVHVIKVSPAADFASSGAWDVAYRVGLSASDPQLQQQQQLEDEGEAPVRTDRFDAVMVCTGKERVAFRPRFENEQEFRGKIMHTQEYRHNESFVGKKVVVIGSGNSAGDVAAELADVCRQVYMSWRSGAWMLHRVYDRGLPWELSFFTRFKFFLGQTLLPRSVARRHLRRVLDAHVDHSVFGIAPDYELGAQLPTVTDFLMSKLVTGTVQLRPGVRRLTATGVEFVDGTTVDDVDVIMCATGYRYDFSFVDHASLKFKNGNEPNLFNLVFPPAIQPSTLAVIGLIDTSGSIPGAGEMQARYAARVFKGLIKLPSAADMQRAVDADKKASLRTRASTNRQFILREYIPYLDCLAEAIGCRPPGFLRLLLTDPRLAFAVYFDLHTSLQYRLVGPGAWPGARDAVLGLMDRLMYPLEKTGPARKVDNGRPTSSRRSGLPYALLLLAIATSMAAVAFGGDFVPKMIGRAAAKFKILSS